MVVPTPTLPASVAAKASHHGTTSSSSVASSGRTRDIQCHRCKGYVHVMCDCSNKRVLLLLDNGEYDSASDFDDEIYAMLATNTVGNEVQEEHVAAAALDMLLSIVVQCVLSTQVATMDKNQCHNLFQTKGVVKQRAIRIIIDGGSCNNLASTDMVDKLALATHPHPHPYYIQWLNQSGKIKVTRSVCVLFAMGSYNDYVDCDVVPMQAYSMLLGRPWQYDTDCVHNDRTNQYTLFFKAKKIVLHPMIPEQIVKDELARTNRDKTHAHTPTTDHVLQQEFQQQHSHSHTTSNEIKLKGPILLATKVDLDELTDHSLDGYAFLCTPVLFSSDDTPPAMPPSVTNLLQEYSNIFPKDVPAGLPPL
jgi:hypothetical protein